MLDVKDPPLIVAIETSSRVGSVALAQGPSLLAEATFSSPLQHSAEIFPAIDRLLNRFGYAPGNVTQVHLAVGPGSFTGLRIAVTIAKMMHLASATTIVTVDSLDAIAANVGDERGEPPLQDFSQKPLGSIAAVLDAKRGQFYAAAYRRVGSAGATGRVTSAANAAYEIPAPGGGIWHKIAPDSLVTAEQLMDRFASDAPLGLLGDGLLYHREKFPPARAHILPQRYWSPRASKVHLLGYQKAKAGLFADPLTLTPYYLRGPLVTLKARP
jgi:tRNA threonylcarbamoyladenosine biosynthesis protein TsaB